MPNAVQTTTKEALPAYIVAHQESNEGNIADRQTVPSLTFGGKTWATVIEGVKTPLMRRLSNGDEEPVQTMRVIVLDYAKERGRQYYVGAFDPNNVTAPGCWSEDGVKPSPKSAQIQNSTCAGCPRAVKGDKVTEAGDATTACRQHRMTAVIPSKRLDFSPLRMKVPMTSDYTGKNQEHEKDGWFAFSRYIDHLRGMGLNNTGYVVTKMKFDPDPNITYPKILFARDSWVSQDDIPIIDEIQRQDAVKNLLGGTWTPAGADGVKQDEDEAPAASNVVKVDPKAAAEKAKALAQAATQKVAADNAAKAPTPDPKAVAKAAKAEMARKAKEEADRLAAEAEADEDEDADETITVASDDDGDDGEIIVPGASSPAADKAKPVNAAPTKPVTTKATAKPKADKPAPAAEEVPGDVEALLGDWG
jgi:hypothetical protein